MTLHVDSTLGAWLDDCPWVPAPRYLLRRWRVLRAFRKLPVGQLIEVGCGPAALLYELHQLGYRCRALETSAAALDVAHQFAEHYPVELASEAPQSWHGSADVLLSMEVLEHIEDDEAALSAWRGLLKPGGYLVLAVPCHMRKWGPLDDWAGHLRRYERSELVTLLSSAGFVIEHFEHYGFPLSNLTSAVRNHRLRRQLAVETVLTTTEKTSKSGVDRSMESGLFPLLNSTFGRLMMHLSFGLQALFCRLPLGDGYLLVARRIDSNEETK